MDNLGLLKSCFRIAIRTLLKSRLTSLVNLTGLTTGLTGCLLIGLFVLDELSYDQHYKHKDQLYRITTAYDRSADRFGSAQTYSDVASVLAGLPEIRQVARIMPADEGFLFIDEKAFKEEIFYADPAVIQVLGLDLLVGNPATCLTNPSSLLISESCAVRFFGEDWRNMTVLGTVLDLDGWLAMTITGVFRDIPHHSHIRSDLFGSLPSGHEDWMGQGRKVYTYVLTHQKVNPDDLDLKIQGLSLPMTQDAEEHQVQLHLQPVTDIYLFSSLEDENAAQGSLKNIYLLLLAALFLIATTITNFINLNAASAFRRLKEVGVRKVLGSLPWQLRLQFLMETLVISAIAMSLALGFVAVVLPFFNQLTGKSVQPDVLLTFNAFILTFGLTLAVSLLAGLYPSIYLSARRAVDALRGSKGKVFGTQDIRSGLVVFQFAVSCVMIILTIVAFRQVRLINTKPLGFDKENTIVLSNPYMLGTIGKITGLRNELVALDGVENVTITGYTPSQERWGNLKFTFPGRDRRSSYARPANWLVVDEGFLGTMGIQLIAGRNFFETHEHDRGSIIVNEKAVEQFGLDANGKDPLGTELSVRNADEGRDEHFRIVGVVQDFNFGSLHEPVKPVVMTLGYHRFEMALRLSSERPAPQTIEKIGAIWSKTLPTIPFEYSYIKDRYDRLHASDTAASRLFLIFCISTIVISALGLFSIITYEIAMRMKEIGIRKLLGASAWDITALISRRFLVLLLVACGLALPLSWIIAMNWIADFAYKTKISWWIFVTGGGLLFFVAVLTLGYQLLKASVANPVDNLRQE